MSGFYPDGAGSNPAGPTGADTIDSVRFRTWKDVRPGDLYVGWTTGMSYLCVGVMLTSEEFEAMMFHDHPPKSLKIVFFRVGCHPSGFFTMWRQPHEIMYGYTYCDDAVDIVEFSGLEKQ